MRFDTISVFLVDSGCGYDVRWAAASQHERRGEVVPVCQRDNGAVCNIMRTPILDVGRFGLRTIVDVVEVRVWIMFVVQD